MGRTTVGSGRLAMTSKEIADRLERIETMVSAIHSILLHERQGQAEEIDKYIEKWKAEVREAVPVAD